MALRTFYSSLIACAAVWLLSGCLQQPTPTGGPQISDILPAGWTPLEFSSGGIFRRGTTWQHISIDGDDAPEYLLFYTYDNGQVGAVIYDEQIGSTETVSPNPVPVPNQPSGLYVPYRLEPSYWDGAGSVGYIAPPGTTAEQITFLQVSRGADDVAAPAPDSAGATSTGANELVIYGGKTVFTVVWWRNPFNGYGITQLFAAGGLVRPVQAGRDGKGPVVNITGLTPIPGYLARSVLCEERLYVRTAATEEPFVRPPVYSSAVKYVANNRGIVFCQGPPTYPFYPEGVVLAFLRPENPANPQQTEQERRNYRLSFVATTQPDAQQREALLNALLDQIDFDGNPRTEATVLVQDLLTPPTLPLTPGYRTPAGGPIMTTVCAQVSSADGMQVRRLLYQLEHVPPTATTSANGDRIQYTDRFTIVDAFDVTNTGPTCAAVMAQSQPASPTLP